MTGFLKLQGEDLVAFIITALAGYAAASVIQNPGASAVVSILVSYHLFLGWLVMNGSGEVTLSLPIGSAVATHAGCLVVALAPVAMADGSIGFGVFRYGVAALAVFERGWLFSQEETRPALDDESITGEPLSPVRATAEDQIAWLEYLSSRRPGMTRPGVSIGDEHKAWLLARHKQREKTDALAHQKRQRQAVPQPGGDKVPISAS
jgi:hypothetical protein